MKKNSIQEIFVLITEFYLFICLFKKWFYLSTFILLKLFIHHLSAALYFFIFMQCFVIGHSQCFFLWVYEANLSQQARYFDYIIYGNLNIYIEFHSSLNEISDRDIVAPWIYVHPFVYPFGKPYSWSNNDSKINNQMHMKQHLEIAFGIFFVYRRYIG